MPWAPRRSRARSTSRTAASFDLENGVTVPSTKALILAGRPVGGESKFQNLSGDSIYDGPVTLRGGDQSIDVSGGSQLTIGGASTTAATATDC